MFPLPTIEERAAIWKIYLKKYELSESADALLEEPFTGAEIRQCADIAWRLNIPLVEAAQYIVPVSISAKTSIEELYSQANGSFLSASYPGPFKKDLSDSKTIPSRGTRRTRVAAPITEPV